MKPTFTHLHPRPALAVFGVSWPGTRAATVLLRCDHGAATGGLPCGSHNSLQLLNLHRYFCTCPASVPSPALAVSMRNSLYRNILKGFSLPRLSRSGDCATGLPRL
jgi:hypothetical protein